MNDTMEKYVERLKDIILENDYFCTLAGQRFREWNEIRTVTAVIAFAGRSKEHKSYRLNPDSESRPLYVTHLYLDISGQVKVQIEPEDTDDFDCILKPTGEPVEAFGEETLKEWVNLLTF